MKEGHKNGEKTEDNDGKIDNTGLVNINDLVA